MGKNVNRSFIKEDSQVAFWSMKLPPAPFLVGEAKLKVQGTPDAAPQNGHNEKDGKS